MSVCSYALTPFCLTRAPSRLLPVALAGGVTPAASTRVPSAWSSITPDALR